MRIRKRIILTQELKVRVKGQVFDRKNNLPIVNQKFVVSEYVNEFRGAYGTRDALVQRLDSTTTDDEGRFDFTFETGGMGTFYKIGPEYDQTVFGGLEEDKRLFNIGGLNQFDFFRPENLYTCVVRITLNDLEYPPFEFKAQTYYHSPSFTISDTTGVFENTIYLRIDLDYIIYFNRLLDDGTRQSGQFQISGQDSLDDRVIELQLTNADFQ